MRWFIPVCIFFRFSLFVDYRVRLLLRLCCPDIRDRSVPAQVDSGVIV
jgi:hypothetical protein